MLPMLVLFRTMSVCSLMCHLMFNVSGTLTGFKFDEYKIIQALDKLNICKSPDPGGLCHYSTIHYAIEELHSSQVQNCSVLSEISESAGFYIESTYR